MARSSSSVSTRSPGRTHDRSPTFDLCRDERAKGVCVQRIRLDTVHTQTLARVGRLQRPLHLACETRHDVGQECRRPRKTEPDGGDELRAAELPECRELGKIRKSLAELAASARNRRARICGAAVESVVEIAWIWPAVTSMTAILAPLYGT